MDKHWMEKTINQEPATLAASYIFLTDNMRLALCIADAGFGSLALLEDSDLKGDFFSTDSFISYMYSISFKGTNRIQYTFIPACFEKWKNDRLEAYFKRESHLRCIPGWKLFMDREYLAKEDYSDDLRKTLNFFLRRHEGPKGERLFSEYYHKSPSEDISDENVSFVEKADQILAQELSEGSDLVIDNGWFTVSNAVRSGLHTFSRQDLPTGVLDGAVVDYITSHVHMFVLDMTVYIYRGGVYAADPHGSQTRELIRSLLYPQMMKSSTMNRIYQQLLDRVQLHRKSDQLNRYPGHWINFRNGFFDVLEWKLIEHDPEYYAMNQIPWTIDPEWKPPDDPGRNNIVEEFLHTCVPDVEDRKMFWEFLGYSMTIDTGFQKFLTLTGPGSTGKSVVIGLMEGLVGPDNLANISLQDLNNRFYPSALHLKLLNTCADIPSLGMQNIDNLKKATGNDALIYERKGKDVSFFHSYCKLVFSANEIPLNLDEKSDAFYRRILILCMDQKIAPEERDPHLLKKLGTESAYIVFHALLGLQRLHKQGRFTESSRCRRAIRELRHRADNVQAFIDTCIRKMPGKRTQRSRIFEAYEDYCHDNRRQSCGKGRFFERLNEHFTLKRYETDGYCYQDIVLITGDGENEFQEDGFMLLEPDEKTPFDTQQ